MGNENGGEKRMVCKEACSNLKAFIYGELPDSRTREMLRHLNSCPDCRDEFNVRLIAIRVDEILNKNADLSYDLKNIGENLLKKRKRQLLVHWILRLLILLVLIGALVFLVLEFTGGWL